MHRRPRDAVGGGHYETIVCFQGLEAAESGGAEGTYTPIGWTNTQRLKGH